MEPWELEFEWLKVRHVVKDAMKRDILPDMNAILRFANRGVKIAKTTVLNVDTTRKSGGIKNLPFSVREAEPVSMKSTFWIQELQEKDANGRTQFRLQYSQVVMLHFLTVLILVSVV